MISYLGTYLQTNLTRVCSFLRSERGQGSLEYIAILIGLIVIVAILFIIFGDQIRAQGCEVVNDVFDANCVTDEGESPDR